MGKGAHNYTDNRKDSDDEEHRDKPTAVAATTVTAATTESSANYSYRTDILADIPTLNAIKKTIPAECFEPTVMKSMYYCFKDAAIIAALYLALCYLESLKLNTIIYMLIYPIYWFLQGTMFTSVFVLGHDCGHGSFSRHKVLNDIMGTILHTFILAPYFPWKVTHRKHHNHTGNIDKDEVFYPKRKSEITACNDVQSKIPIPVGFGLAIGWFSYLVKGYCPRHVNHFNPFEKMFSSHMFGIMCSLICYALWCLCLLYYGFNYGFFALISHHIIPTLVFASYIVIITFLHHNEPELPWFPNEEWNYVKGQLTTVDRHYGVVHGVIHNIGTHQIHHLFTSIPHYNLEKATKAFRKEYPHLVNIREERILVQFFKQFQVYMREHVIDDIKEKNFKAYYYSNKQSS